MEAVLVHNNKAYNFQEELNIITIIKRVLSYIESFLKDMLLNYQANLLMILKIM